LSLPAVGIRPSAFVNHLTRQHRPGSLIEFVASEGRRPTDEGRHAASF
jgi:hypothetical protein